MSRLSRIEMVVHLQSVDLFSFCTAEQVVRMAEIGRERTFPAREAIYRRNEPADVMYCIVDGMVELSGDHGSRQLEAPATFGVREILSDQPRTEDARAEGQVTVLAFDAEDFFDLLSNNIEIVKALFRQLLRTGAEQRAPRGAPTAA